MYLTLAKLTAALGFAALAWVTTQLVVQDLAEPLRPGWTAEVNAVIGAVLGWRICGRHAGRGMVEGMAVGVTTGVATLFSALFVWAGHEMLRRAMRLRYEGPMEGFEDMIETMIDYATLTWPGPALPVLAAGSVLAGVAVEFVQRMESR